MDYANVVAGTIRNKKIKNHREGKEPFDRAEIIVPQKLLRSPDYPFPKDLGDYEVVISIEGTRLVIEGLLLIKGKT